MINPFYLSSTESVVESCNQTILKETHKVQPPLGVSDSRNNPGGSESGRSTLCRRASKETLWLEQQGRGRAGSSVCVCGGGQGV